MHMKGITGNDGDVTTGGGTMPHEVKRRLRKTMRGKTGEAAAGDARRESERCWCFFARVRRQKGPRRPSDATLWFENQSRAMRSRNW